MENFKEGDVVILKSDGPKMTISNVYENGIIRTKWFDGAKVMTYDFYATELKLVEEKEY